MGNEKSKQKKFDAQSKAQFDDLDLNQDGVLTQDEIRKNLLEYKSSDGLMWVAFVFDKPRGRAITFENTAANNR